MPIQCWSWEKNYRKCQLTYDVWLRRHSKADSFKTGSTKNKKKARKVFFLNKKVLSSLLNIAPPCRDHLATLQGASIRKLITLDTWTIIHRKNTIKTHYPTFPESKHPRIPQRPWTRICCKQQHRSLRVSEAHRDAPHQGIQYRRQQ